MSDPGVVPRGWRIRLVILWAAAGALLLGALLLFYSYGARITEINRAYLAPDLSQADIEAIDAQWFAAGLMSQIGTPLLSAAGLVAIVTLAVHTRGWQLRRERARAPRPDRPAL